MDIERLIIVAPIEPSPTGNGLAMRTDLFLRSAPEGLTVRTVVVPVAGRLSRTQARAPGVAVVRTNPPLARAGIRTMLQQAVWRTRFERADRLPPLARAASPGLVDAVVSACAGNGRTALHVMRSYLAPLGAAVAERLGPAWSTLDLDEDDAGFARTAGNEPEASAYERLIAVFAPLFDGLSAASDDEARTISRRHGLRVEHLPNAVDIPAPRPRRRRADRKLPYSLLFVGNLTYEPNAEAARALAEEILPRVRLRLGAGVRLTLVGRHRADLGCLAREDVHLTGFAQDLAPLYDTADAVVAPLRTGAGTRIKLLEAFAQGAPVVASPAAAAGLEVTHGRHLLLASDAEEMASAIARVLTEPLLAGRLADDARMLVRDRYSTEVVVRRVRDFFARAALRAPARSQLLARS